MTVERFTFPQSEAPPPGGRPGESDSETLFRMVCADDRNGRWVVPSCVGLAQGFMPTQNRLGTGRVSFGPSSMMVGEAAIHLIHLKAVSNAEHLRAFMLDQYADVFSGFTGSALLFEFTMSQTSSVDTFLVGFSDPSHAELFAGKVAERFRRPATGF